MKSILATFALVATFAATAFAANQPPANEDCPVCGKNGRLIFHSEYQGKRIIFHSADCKKKFDQSPGKYPIKEVKK